MGAQHGCSCFWVITLQQAVPAVSSLRHNSKKWCWCGHMLAGTMAGMCQPPCHAELSLRPHGQLARSLHSPWCSSCMGRRRCKQWLRPWSCTPSTSLQPAAACRHGVDKDIGRTVCAGPAHSLHLYNTGASVASEWLVHCCLLSLLLKACGRYERKPSHTGLFGAHFSG